jgi:hypothetical protein
VLSGYVGHAAEREVATLVPPNRDFRPREVKQRTCGRIGTLDAEVHDYSNLRRSEE